VKIPDQILEADKALYSLLQQVAFSRHLNPTNARAARRAFLRGCEAPPFAYLPLEDADSLRVQLDKIQPPRDHPAGALVGECIDGVALLITALHTRSAADFDRLNLNSGWYPDETTLAASYPADSPTEPLDVGAAELIAHFECAFDARKMADWHIETDEVMSARVLVDSAKKLIRINPKSNFRAADLTRLVVHEIDVHVQRATNGERQPLRCFVTGLPGSLATEEGLAMVAEECSGTASPGALARQAEVCRAISLARHLGFRDLYADLCERVSPGLAWGICLRIKRGLDDPSKPGVYAKDTVYLVGRNKVRAWLDAGGDIHELYVGKVSVDHPVADWLKQGWLKAGHVPALWSSYASAVSPGST
jgi:hypothetical protein